MGLMETKCSYSSLFPRNNCAANANGITKFGYWKSGRYPTPRKTRRLLYGYGILANGHKPVMGLTNLYPHLATWQIRRWNLASNGPTPGKRTGRVKNRSKTTGLKFGIHFHSRYKIPKN